MVDPSKQEEEVEIIGDKQITQAIKGKTVSESQIFLRQQVSNKEEEMLGLEDEINIMNEMDSGDEELEDRWN